MKNFFIIIFLAVCPLSIAGQTVEYDATEYDCTEYQTICEDDEKQTFTIFPNPTSDYFEVKGCDEKEGRLYSITGQFVRTIQLTQMIDVSDLPKGAYFIKINSKIEKLVIN